MAMLIFTGCTGGAYNNNNTKIDTSADEPEIETPDLREERDLYVKMYQADYRLSLATPDSNYHYFVRHHCLFDSAVVVPARYNFDTNREFVTHSFESEIIITRGNDTISNKRITKADFRSELHPSLDSFGVVLPPTCKVVNASLLMDYSISIPITDVGVGVTILVDTLGNISIRK